MKRRVYDAIILSTKYVFKAIFLQSKTNKATLISRIMQHNVQIQQKYH